ncbi:S1C family serine protease [Streptomyces nitrosporeus]|uniref:S1C family serine protease n=1 Tax=Streptomyces nitrosporeus TaxID=28894 RepID=UPI0039A040DA
MTDSHRPSGEYPMYPSYGNGEAAYPPPPAYGPPPQAGTAGAPGAPTRSAPGAPGTWPAPAAAGAGTGPDAGRPERGRRAGRPVALLAAVAIVAAAIGGGSAALVGELSGGGTGTPGAGSAVSGTTVSQRSAGTVAGVAQAVSPAIVEISAVSGSGEATGSGVVITPDGEIVTNNHVISGASRIEVALSTGKTYTADVVGTDAAKDLALIRLQGASGLKTATLGDSSSVEVGDEVVAIGSPEGLTGTVTSGIVSALDRDVTVAKDDDTGGGNQGQGQPGGGDWPFEFGGRQFNGDTGSSTTTYKAIQTDASLNPGNSGGALINMDGEIIGINSAMYSPSSSSTSGSSAAGSVGLGFAIPVDTVKADLDGLRSGDGS